MGSALQEQGQKIKIDGESVQEERLRIGDWCRSSGFGCTRSLCVEVPLQAGMCAAGTADALQQLVLNKSKLLQEGPALLRAISAAGLMVWMMGVLA
jgi:hypothetical protein